MPLSFFRKCVFISALCCLAPSMATARVFDFNDRTLATYLRGSWGLNNLQQSVYQPGFPSSVSFSGNMSQSFSGEFGFSYSSSRYLTLRFGAEVLYPLPVTGLSGTDSSGNKLLSVDSQIYSIIPQINIETFLHHWNAARFYIGGGIGYAITTIKNTVTMTAQGTSTLGLNDYIEEATGWGVMGQGFLGYEIEAFDQVSLSLDVGYRYLTVNNYSANRPFTSPAGTVSVGDQLKNANGTNRSTDLSGPFASLAFRFYIE